MVCNRSARHRAPRYSRHASHIPRIGRKPPHSYPSNQPPISSNRLEQESSPSPQASTSATTVASLGVLRHTAFPIYLPMNLRRSTGPTSTVAGSRKVPRLRQRGGQRRSSTNSSPRPIFSTGCKVLARPPSSHRRMHSRLRHLHPSGTPYRPRFPHPTHIPQDHSAMPLQIQIYLHWSTQEDQRPDPY